MVNHIRKSQKLLFTQSGIEYSDTAPDLFSAPVMPSLADMEVERGQEESFASQTRFLSFGFGEHRWDRYIHPFPPLQGVWLCILTAMQRCGLELSSRPLSPVE